MLTDACFRKIIGSLSAIGTPYDSVHISLQKTRSELPSIIMSGLRNSLLAPVRIMKATGTDKFD